MRSSTACLAAAILIIGGCKGGGDGGQRLMLTGSSTVAPLATEIARRFEARHPGVRVDVQMGGSSRGMADARQGLCDIGMMSRALKPGEEDLTATTIAHDGIGIIVHADNPVAALEREQIIGIYKGAMTSWAEVGGGQGAITVVNKAEGRSTLELFLEHFGLKNSEVKAHVVIGDNEQGVLTVAGNPNAIGYVSIGTAESDVAHGVPIKLVRLGEVEASSSKVKAGSYPLSRPLNLVTGARTSKLAQEFIAFASSAEVKDLVQGAYFVPPTP